MMLNVWKRVSLVAMALCVLATGAVVEASVLSLKAVKKNGTALSPGVCNMGTQTCSSGNTGRACTSNNDCHVATSSVNVAGGDTIETEIYLSGWAPKMPAGVRVFQAKIDGSVGMVSPDNGTALPLGWCAPVNKLDCADSSTCPAEFPTCLTNPPSGCTCAGHLPTQGAFIDGNRAAYLLKGEDANDDVNTQTLNMVYFGLAIDSIGIADSGVPRYLGTMILKVSANACGTFTIGFVNDFQVTFIADPASPPNFELPTLQSLTMTVSDCSRQLLSCDPLHCFEDARIAHDRNNNTVRFNNNSFKLTFSKPTTGMAATDFEVTHVPLLPGDIIPSIVSVTPDPVDNKKTTVLFNRRIAQTRWTCVRDKGSNKRCCQGSLPGDGDANLLSQPADTFEIYDNLQGGVAPPLSIEKCDTDRGGSLTAPPLCSPADLLMVVDLINGADAFVDVNGDTLPTCPPMRPPQ